MNKRLVDYIKEKGNNYFYEGLIVLFSELWNKWFSFFDILNVLVIFSLGINYVERKGDIKIKLVRSNLF